jgi:hypothetical protein
LLIKVLNAADRITNEPLKWEEQLNKLKECRSNWSSRKKIMEETLAAEKNVSDVLKWIKKESDPEQALKEIESRVTSKGEYQSCAQWFLDGPQFKDWSKRIYSQVNPRESKRVIWIRGPYGTGKSTIVFVKYPSYELI